jgi:predicted aconitase with swiveling domain
MLEQRGWLATLRAAGVEVIVDTCVVVTPIVRARGGVLMTNSGKFAHYSPGNIGLQVVFGSLEECVRSGAAGEVWRDAGLWATDGDRAQGPELSPVAETLLETSDTRPHTESDGRALVSGLATGEALMLDAPLSLWGGLEPETGDIIDQRHPQWGANVTGKVLVMPVGKGSSSASSILLESVRLGTAPAAILLAEPDAILALGSAVARELYGGSPPVVVLDGDRYRRIKPGEWLEIEAGTSEVLARPAPPTSEV